MKQKKRLVALLTMLAITASMLFACGDGGDKNTTGDNTGNETSAEATTETPTEDFPELPQGQTFGGEEFRILLSGWSGVDFEVEEETGDRLNDAIYQRNKKIEEKYDVVIKTINLDSFDSFGPSSDAYRKSVNSGADTYDAFFGIQQYSLVDSMNGLNVEYNEDLPYVNLDKPWWDSGILDVCYGNKVYFAAGDITHSTLGYTTLLLFNKYLFQEHKLDYPYQSVKDGTWTYDNFISLIKDLSQDLNNDGKMKTGDDLFSISGWQYEIPYNFHTSLGGNEVIKDAQGYPQINIFSEKSINALNKILDIFSDYGGYFNNSGYGVDRDMFKKRQVFMIDSRFFEIERYLRDMEDDFGMIPHPKPDESTPYYTQLVNNNVVTVTTVPMTNTKLEMTSILLEELAYEGWKTITPEYKEVLLQTKLTRDDESADMFDYIWGHRTYRYGLVAYDNVLNSQVVGRANRSFMSVYEKLNSRAEKELNEIKTFFFQ